MTSVLEKLFGWVHNKLVCLKIFKNRPLYDPQAWELGGMHYYLSLVYH